ncbi:MAG: hypothetical protein ACI4PU_05780 [Intestinibacter sp.]
MQDRDYVKLKKRWYDEDDELLNLYDMQEEFFEKGEFAIGAIVMANTKLFKWGILDLPACIVYTFDEYYNDSEHMRELVSIADQMYNLAGKRHEDKVLKQIAYVIESEVERLFGIRLPDDITGGREVFFTTIMVNRKYLPGKKLDRSVYPFNILRGRRPDAMMIPHWYW